MSDETKFTASFTGIAALLRSPMVGEQLLAMAEQVKARAEEIAPVDTSQYAQHSGRYKASFSASLGVNGRLNRAEAVVSNSAPEAIDVEKGNSNQEGQHVLMRALDIIRGGL